MGLVVRENLVTVDHQVKHHLVSTVEGNPKVSSTDCGLRVTSIFTRLKASAKARRGRLQIGDNCPMLYALKAKDGLITNHSSIRLLTASGREILGLISQDVAADTVVYMPSGYNLSRIIAKRCAKAFDAQLLEGVFRKTTKLEAYEMLSIADRNGDISPPDKQSLLFRMKKSAGFSLKDIPVSFRQFFVPLHLAAGFEGVVKGRVVLVDDLLASGQTLSVAAALIRGMPGVTSVEAVCLFSNV
ncbi:hypothetical protein IPC1147_32970 [Pseudomonas aeruginosa]|uniref:phosphoribosyltransferase n=1 Tax=Pseudomonas aeruginosa TaxID=287 RepID=UPI000F51F6D5|nr:phosphoribosyltransferase [Pseudomonas aeruginosa]MBA5106133.1 phosphoribosyltransferase [Pseudomonas aeruginosa]MBD1300816.1 phosphoribosyltransferase [Pseudomonas aeruginosa]MBD1341576.1 phosphoribosyltransferase [Pseudomonas aeruginosa]MBH3592902.1 phosphoribosyltransferase [Pseudomonas aeruginosa]MCO2528509.1 phosphoribosyltransferase [Pseudomonas aeruginosa]